MAEQSADVVVIGGGVIGCAVAYYASKAGLKVIVLESVLVGGQGSSVAAGLVAPSPQIKDDGPFTQLALASLAYLPQLRDELHADSAIDIELEERGSLKIATDEKEANELQRLLPKKQQLGLDVEWLTTKEVIQIEPGVTQNIKGAIYNPKEGQLNTSKLLSAYYKGAIQHGALFVRRRAIKLLTRDTKVVGVQLVHGRVFAKQTVIASGAWAAEQGRWLGIELPIRPQRGQLITLGKTDPKLRHLVFWQDIYLSPKSDDSTTIGAFNDYVGHIQVPTAKGVMSLLSQGSEAMPSLICSTFLGAKAGLRAKTPDKLPIIGAVPGWEGIQIAAGHNSNGLLFSAMTGKFITTVITKGNAPIMMAAFSLDRFSSSN